MTVLNRIIQAVVMNFFLVGSFCINGMEDKSIPIKNNNQLKKNNFGSAVLKIVDDLNMMSTEGMTKEALGVIGELKDLFNCSGNKKLSELVLNMMAKYQKCQNVLWQNDIQPIVNLQTTSEDLLENKVNTIKELFALKKYNNPLSTFAKKYFNVSLLDLQKEINVLRDAAIKNGVFDMDQLTGIAISKLNEINEAIGKDEKKQKQEFKNNLHKKRIIQPESKEESKQELTENINDEELAKRLSSTSVSDDSHDKLLIKSKRIKKEFKIDEKADGFYKSNNSDIYQGAFERITHWWDLDVITKLEKGEIGNNNFSMQENFFCHRFSPLVSSFVGQASSIPFALISNETTSKKTDRIYYLPAYILSHQLNGGKVKKYSNAVMFEFALTQPIEESNGMKLLHANCKLLEKSSYEDGLKNNKNIIERCKNFGKKNIAESLASQHHKTKKQVTELIEKMNKQGVQSRICLDCGVESCYTLNSNNKDAGKKYIHIQEIYDETNGDKTLRDILIPCAVLNKDALKERLK